MKKVEIEWKDARHLTGWFDEGEVKGTGLAQVKSTGYLFSKDKDCVRLVLGYDATEKLYIGVQLIPRSWVTKITELK